MADLKPPPSNDPQKLKAWVDDVVGRFKDSNNPQLITRARRLQVLVEDPTDFADEIPTLVAEITRGILLASLEAARSSYSELIEPTEEMLQESGVTDEDKAEVQKALGTYRAIVEFFDKAHQAIASGAQDADQQMKDAANKAHALIQQL